jgi:hypothetical protein
MLQFSSVVVEDVAETGESSDDILVVASGEDTSSTSSFDFVDLGWSLFLMDFRDKGDDNGTNTVSRFADPMDGTDDPAAFNLAARRQGDISTVKREVVAGLSGGSVPGGITRGGSVGDG